MTVVTFVAVVTFVTFVAFVTFVRLVNPVVLLVVPSEEPDSGYRQKKNKHVDAHLQP